MEKEIAGLQAQAERVAEEARELAGEVPFLRRNGRAFIDRLLAEGEESAEATAEKDREYDSTASALEGNGNSTRRRRTG